MLNRMKDYLGIEGINVKLDIEEPIVRDSQRIRGRVMLSSHREQRIEYVRLTLTERYARGRGKEKLVDEYEIGSLRLRINAVVPAKKPVYVPFKLNFVQANSPIEDLADRNPLMRPLSFLAKKIKSVSSRYFVRVEAEVPGTALNPFDQQEVELVG